MDDNIQITPISHATMVLQMGGQVIYTDPVDGEEAFAGQPAPTIILITDVHHDHMNADTLTALTKNNPVIVASAAVADQLSENLSQSIVILKNGETTTQKGIEIEAIPMYNIPESPETFHAKGRGNGYVVSAEGKMKDNPDLIAQDGLHPSAKEYKLWEQMIFPVAYSVLK